MPAAVALHHEGHLVAGGEAVAVAAQFPSRAVFFSKRLLGRKLYGPEVTWLAGASPIELVPGDNGDAWVRLESQRFSPEELAATILRTVVSEAGHRIGKPIETAVLAAPATFDLPQRHALMHAAELAGLSPLRMVESSAAFVHSLDVPASMKTVVVVDIGGGYFDICALRRRPKGWTVLGSDGDPMLGGDDFDRRIIDSLIARFYDEHYADLTRSPAALHRLRLLAKDLRHRAAQGSDAQPIRLDNLAEVDGKQISLEAPPMDAAALEALWTDEVDAIWPACVRLFSSLGLGTEDVDGLFLIGGGSKVPAVATTLEELFRKKPERPPASALGSARGAAALAARSGGGDETMRSSFPHTLSVKVRDGKVSRVSTRNAPLPVTAGRLFAAAPPTQRTLTFEVYQGDAEYARDNLYIARFIIHVIRNQRHYVKFIVDTCGRLSVTATAASSGAAVPVEARFSSGLVPDEFAAVTARMQQLAQRAQRFTIDDSPTFDDDDVPTVEVDSVPRQPSAPMPLVPTTAVPISDSVPISDATPSSGSKNEGTTTEARSRARRPVTRDTRGGADAIKSLPSRGTHSGGANPLAATQPSSSTIDDHSIVGSTVGGRYEITGVIAEGGMGCVYHATHRILDRDYAVKVIHPELANNRTLVERFLREAQSAARIKSDHVVEILDFGALPDGTSYFVMEYLDGMSLEEVLDDGVMPLPEVISVATQMARGLAAAHELGIVHRDLKPANVLLIPWGKRALVKILDFGIAKIPTSDGEKLTLVNSIVGTPHYMAPEQVDGTVDNRTDIYALGAVMYEMLTRHPPFDDESVALLLAKHRTQAPPNPRDVVGERCPPGLENVILRCLAKNKDQRFQTADELTNALDAVAAEPYGRRV